MLNCSELCNLSSIVYKSIMFQSWLCCVLSEAKNVLIYVALMSIYVLLLFVSNMSLVT